MNERKTIHRWFWVWDFEKEEQWLNEMVQSGWLLESVGFCVYHFAPCSPGEYTIRLEMHDHDAGYLEFMKETGAEYIGRMAKWIYFRKRTADGTFDIFSDIDSKIKHLSKIENMLFVLGVINLILGIMGSFSGFSMGRLSLICTTVLMYGLGRIHGKKETLEADRFLHE